MSPGHIHHALPPKYVAAARDVRYHSTATLTFLVWDFLVMLDDEVEYIWPMRNKNPLKWVYFSLRYAVILAHVAHNSFFGALANGSNPPILCRMWLPYVMTLAQIIQTLLELILACRVYALYNRSRRIASLLSILILTEVGGTVRMLWLGDDPDIYGTCLLVALSKDGMKQSLLAFVVHCSLIVLTLFKYYVALRAGWGRTPLVSLVVRDNSTVYATIIFIVASVVVIFGLQNERGVTVFYWSTALASFSGIRMILRMERFARNEISMRPSPEPPLFTSEFSLRTFGHGIWHDRSIP